VPGRALALQQYAAAHAPFFARHHHGWRAGHAPWAALPTMDKALLMAHFDEAVTDPAVREADVRRFAADPRRIGTDYLGRYAVWTSSGTTGHPGLFLHDAQALAVYTLLTATRTDQANAWRNWIQGVCWRGGRTVLVAATGAHYAGISFWQRQCRALPWVAANATALSVTLPLPDLCAALERLQPAFLSSYPSLLGELAGAQARGELHIAPVALWAGGECLSEPMRRHIEAVFGTTVANDYGASECLAIANECGHGRLHVNDDWVLLEAVDAEGRPVPPGVPSHTVLLTNLANRIQPLIRYDLGDSITWHADACACGSPRPTLAVQGRHDDALQLHDARGRTIEVSPMAAATAVEEAVDLQPFQICQVDASHLRLRMAVQGLPAGAARAVRARAAEALRAFLRGRGLGHVAVREDAAAPQVQAGSGKLRQVIRL
jgi:phenylacetate-coenzyme A ligase PaaK-like adenylate-forming protein